MQKAFKTLLLVLVVGFLTGYAPPANASTEDFTIKSFEADYYLSKNSDNTSQLRVVEKIVAEFPGFDQNHGILRAIPEKYQGHDVELKVEKVTDVNGQKIQYDTSSSSDNKVLKIGDPDRYVHSEQTYVISYSQRNVTANFGDKIDFYWDVNGDQWSQVFKQVTARVHVPNDLAGKLQTNTACYTGSFGGTANDCRTNKNEQTGEVVYTFATTKALQSKETLTFRISFAADIFGPAKMSQEKLNWLIFGVVVALIPPIVALWFAVRGWYRSGRDPKGKGVIVPQYLPPKEASVLASNAVLTESFQAKSISAQIIDLAVRHYIKIYEVKIEKKFAKDKTTYELELLKNPLDLRADERQVIEIVFGKTSVTGARVSIDKLTGKLYKEAESLGKTVTEELVTSGLFSINPDKAKRPYVYAGIVLMIVGFASVFVFIFSLGLIAAGLILLIASPSMPARTAKGVELRDYLLGLRDYMKLAEADRIKIMQSPGGATRGEPVDTGDNKTLVKLYEKLLPYAMLFGIEKEWVKQFAELYDQQPDWYSGGSSSFHPALFVASLHSFGTASNSSFSPPSSSSSGAGFSGGGGGGGGGGGW